MVILDHRALLVLAAFLGSLDPLARLALLGLVGLLVLMASFLAWRVLRRTRFPRTAR